MLTLLQKATARSKQSKFMKLSLGPRKFTRPNKLKTTGQLAHVDAKLFYGRKMEVVLPEPISIAIWRYGVFESDVAFYLLSSLRSGDCFIDIGGHFGYFSMLAREIVGEEGIVVSFEPMPKTREILTRNLTQNAAKAHQIIVPVAAGEKAGNVKFKDFGLVGSAFATSETDRGDMASFVEVDVEIRTIDQVVKESGLSDCRLIKIDAENAELQVVRGALSTLAAFSPRIILETGDGANGENNSAEVVALLNQHGYVAYEFNNWELVPHEMQAVYGYKNLLFIRE